MTLFLGVSSSDMTSYRIIASIVFSIMVIGIGIGMNQAVNGQYYDYATGTYHPTNTTVFNNVPAINTTGSNTQYSNEIPREADGPHIQELIKQNQATESYRAELEAYIDSHNVHVPSYLVLIVDDLEAIVKEHIATGSSSGAVPDIVNRVFKPSFDTVGKLIDAAANDAKFKHSHK